MASTSHLSNSQFVNFQCINPQELINSQPFSNLAKTPTKDNADDDDIMFEPDDIESVERVVYVEPAEAADLENSDADSEADLESNKDHEDEAEPEAENEGDQYHDTGKTIFNINLNVF